MGYSASDIAFMREQIRMVVDPLLMRMRAELYDGNTYGRIGVNKMPVGTITDEDAFQEEIFAIMASEGLAVPSRSIFQTSAAGVQIGRLLAYVNGVVVHADATNIAHAGNIVGIAYETKGSNAPVSVHNYGLVVKNEFNFTQTGIMFVGTDGLMTKTLDTNAVFSQLVGCAIDTRTIFIMLTNQVYIL